MDRESSKIALACFIGGAACVVAAALIVPHFWWLGLLAGPPAGYFAYDLRKVVLAVPSAFAHAKVSTAASRNAVVRYWRPFWAGFAELIDEVQTILVPVAILLAPLYYSEALVGFNSFLHAKGAVEVVEITILTLALFVVWFCVTVIAMVMFELLVELGGFYLMHEYFTDSVVSSDDSKKVKSGIKSAGHRVEELTARGFTGTERTYGSVLLYALYGVLTVVGGAIGLSIWFVLRLGSMLLPLAFEFAVTMAIKFLRLIHSQKRILCAVDGTLGGAFVLWRYWDPGAGLAQVALLAVFGGTLGAFLGVLNWELVSKRVFHVAAES